MNFLRHHLFIDSNFVTSPTSVALPVDQSDGRGFLELDLRLMQSRCRYFYCVCSRTLLIANEPWGANSPRETIELILINPLFDFLPFVNCEQTQSNH